MLGLLSGFVHAEVPRLSKKALMSDSCCACLTSPSPPYNIVLNCLWALSSVGVDGNVLLHLARNSEAIAGCLSSQVRP